MLLVLLVVQKKEVCKDYGYPYGITSSLSENNAGCFLFVVIC